ncbi:hypothetical protein D9Q98_001921 [Chlorella vulgaris]|uniref:GATA-type domain-containing protein n=1 Tax=Chlorella vulgaris TaxID=3077 RepID=A0A9D4TVG0_CHLVU|nr:hypothetical protein D9Q98_001921 [Chlorella vulgaris]
MQTARAASLEAVLVTSLERSHPAPAPTSVDGHHCDRVEISGDRVQGCCSSQRCQTPRLRLVGCRSVLLESTAKYRARASGPSGHACRAAAALPEPRANLDMDCTCNCFGVATAARVPVKRYNLLVPDVFPVVEPSFDKPLGITIERKIKKLADYLDKNEYRAPKVSRRLQRRLHKELGAGNFGYVKLAVQTYCYLLEHNKAEKSNLLANELVVRTVVTRRTFVLAGPKDIVQFPEPHLGSAIGLLLCHPLPQLRKLGVDLLISFIKCQQTSDYVPQLESFVPLLCQNAKPEAATASNATSAVAASELADHWAVLHASCLRALLEHLRFCARLSYVSYHLHTITFAVLACVDASGQGAPQGVYTSPRALLQDAGDNGEQRALDAALSMTRGSISHVVAASPPAVAALLVFEELAHMTRDAAEGKKVLEFVMRFLDQERRWLGSPVLETSMAVLQAACQQEHQRYLLFSSLMRHVAAAPSLMLRERAAVLRLAVHESRQLEQALAAPALLLALRELPAVIASHGDTPAADVPPMPSLLPATPPRPASRSPAQPGAQQELQLAELTAAGHAEGGGGDVSLQAQVLEAVGQLAARVQDSTQLLEVVSGTLGKLRGSAPISTAALQCCVAAGQAVQSAAPPQMSEAALGAPHTFPSLLLRELAGIAAGWQMQQRLLAHKLMLQMLPVAVDGLKEQQAAMLLSAVWHAAALEANQPAAFVALEQTLRALLAAAPASSLSQVLKLVAALQLEVLGASGGPAGGRLAQLSAAQSCAVLCVCSSVLQALAAQLGQPAVQQLAVPGCGSALQQLAVVQPHGLVLSGVMVDDHGPEAASRQQQQFWQGPAVTLTFSAEEQQQAAAFLASWRQGSNPAILEAALAAALATVPLFKQQGSVAAGSFHAMPVAALLPRLLSGDSSFQANGFGDASSGGDSKRAQRLRSMYRHMRQVSLSDGDRAALASISHESATQEPGVDTLEMRGLVLPWLGGDSNGSGHERSDAAKSADGVLAEVEEALMVAEEALERGRSPSPAAWHSVGGGSSASGRNGSARLHPFDLETIGLHGWTTFEGLATDHAPEPSLEGTSPRLFPEMNSLEPIADHFPCIADELEEQAKLLEGDGLSPNQALTATAAGKAAQQDAACVHRIPLAATAALRPPCLDVLVTHTKAVQKQQQQEQQEGEQQRPQTPKEGEVLERRASGLLREEPCTPQRHSAADDSSWNETPLTDGGSCSHGLETGEVQSPAPLGPVNLLSLPHAPEDRQRPPLAAAIRNARSVRLGRSHGQGAWRGCSSAWCSLDARHKGSCNAAATVPGLLAYPPHELFQSGVNVEELCRAPQDLEELAPDTESEGEGARPAATAADCLSSGKRCADTRGEDDGASHSQCGAGAASSGSMGAAVDQQQQQQQQQQQPAKRLRVDASSQGMAVGGLQMPPLPLPLPIDLDSCSPLQQLLLPPMPQPLPPSTSLSPLMHPAPAMVPVESQLPARCVYASGSMPPFAPSVPPPNLGAFMRNLGRPAGAPRLRPLPLAPPPPPPPPPAPLTTHTPSKPVTRQKQVHTPAGAAAPAVPRSSGRKTVLQWHTDSVVDPRSGTSTSSVQPGTFCTQCFALSTPVWRAGPFGHKTLCNACGVRWMKYAKGGSKK